MASSGFQADVKALQKVLSTRHLTPVSEVYELLGNGNRNVQQAVKWLEQLIPFSLFLLVVFIRQHLQGKGCVFTYDAVGSYERRGRRYIVVKGGNAPLPRVLAILLKNKVVPNSRFKITIA
ncbi:hypothetical protein S83_003203 [Arachis hypogaea]